MSSSSSIEKLAAWLKDWDVYGHPVNTHFEGQTSYKTWLGFTCTMAINVIILQITIVLA